MKHGFSTIRILLAALVGVALTSCTVSNPTVGTQLGSPTSRTPYDRRYERVRLYLREVRAKITYTPEQKDRDYWQLPEETESLGTGDCEDLAIWLYVKMKRAGLERVRLCIGKHTADASQMHAWVLWLDGTDLYILDPSVTEKPLRQKDAEKGSYIPYYSYDGDRKWRHKAAG